MLLLVYIKLNGCTLLQIFEEITMLWECHREDVLEHCVNLFWTIVGEDFISIDNNVRPEINYLIFVWEKLVFAWWRGREIVWPLNPTGHVWSAQGRSITWHESPLSIKLPCEIMRLFGTSYDQYIYYDHTMTIYSMKDCCMANDDVRDCPTLYQSY